MNKENKCELINSESDLDKAIKNKEELFVLFYATWCPFSRDFLPHYIESANKNAPCHVRVIVDNDDKIQDRFKIEIYPTVLYFKNGKLTRRLDGIPHEGLSDADMKDFLENCIRK